MITDSYTKLLRIKRSVDPCQQCPLLVCAINLNYSPKKVPTRSIISSRTCQRSSNINWVWSSATMRRMWTKAWWRCGIRQLVWHYNKWLNFSRWPTYPDCKAIMYSGHKTAATFSRYSRWLDSIVILAIKFQLINRWMPKAWTGKWANLAAKRLILISYKSSKVR